eukprot:scaffold651702_cov56-Prasinocladus_malaysianus.AAC.1
MAFDVCIWQPQHSCRAASRASSAPGSRKAISGVCKRDEAPQAGHSGAANLSDSFVMVLDCNVHFQHGFLQ